MKRLALFLIFATTVGYAQAPRPEIAVRRIDFQGAAGVVEVSGQIKNLTKEPFENIKITFEFLKGRKVVQRDQVTLEGVVEPGEWYPFRFRTEGVLANDYRISFQDRGGNQLLWVVAK